MEANPAVHQLVVKFRPLDISRTSSNFYISILFRTKLIFCVVLEMNILTQLPSQIVLLTQPHPADALLQ